MSERISSDGLIELLHDSVGLCGHCGKRDCHGRKGNSILPETIKTTVLLGIINGMRDGSLEPQSAIAAYDLARKASRETK